MTVDSGKGAGLIGAVLQDRYRLTRLIGRGGMGAVYEGVQLHLNKRVAVKLMARELSASEEALARFRREAEVTSQLGHPHIVHVFDFGEAPSGEPYLVMEYLEGEDLDHRISRVGRFSLAATIRIVKQVASALAATHARGIIHRDLKPANIFLVEIEGEDDFVKVVDFGISKVRVAAIKLTGESAVMGTPSYMSPEQATGRVDEIDHRADEWALACITYEMLCGRPPFRGENPSAVLYQAIHLDPAPLAGRVPGLSVEVDRVLGRGLAKQQGDRFPTVTAFTRALEAIASGPVPAGKSVPESPLPLERLPETTEKEQSSRVTTFSQTAGEITNPLSRFKAKLKRPWVIVAIGAVSLLIAAVMTMRPIASRRLSGQVAPTHPSPTAAIQPVSIPTTRTQVEQAVPPIRLVPITSTPPASQPETHPPNAVESVPRPSTTRKAQNPAGVLAPTSVTRPTANPGFRRGSPSGPAAVPAQAPSARSKPHLIQDL